MTSFPRCDATAAWAALRGHFEAHGRDLDLREAFARDPARFERFGVEAPEVFCDLSKNRIDAATLHFLADLARECGVESWRDAMLSGEAINLTEGRAVLHTALRAPPGAAPFSDEVHATREAMLAFAETVRARAEGGARPLRHVVNIGIGGSDLGPQMAVAALAPFAHPRLELHFVSNVDGHDIASVLRRVAPAETLFIIASKTFTTQETMANAATAKAWFLEGGGGDVAEHFVAATTNVEAAARFGITPHLRLSRLGRRPLLALVGDRPADRDRDRRRGLSRAARRRAGDGRAFRRGADREEPADAARPESTSGTATSTASPAAASPRITTA